MKKSELKIGQTVVVIKNDGCSINDFVGKVGVICTISEYDNAAGIDFGKKLEIDTWSLSDNSCPNKTGRYYNTKNIKIHNPLVTELL